MSSQFPDPPGGGKYPITDIYKTFSPDALQQMNDYLSAVNPLNLSLGNVRGFQGTGAMIVVDRKELAASAASFDFTPIPQQFSHLRMLIYARGTVATAAVPILLRLNGDTGANYYYQVVSNSSTLPSGGGVAADTSILIGQCPAASASSGFFTTLEVVIPFYHSANKKSMHRINYHLDATSPVDQTIAVGGGSWDNSAAINRIQLTPTSGSFAAGSIATLYAHN